MPFRKTSRVQCHAQNRTIAFAYLSSSTKAEACATKVCPAQTWLQRVLTLSLSFERASALTLGATKVPLDPSPLLVCLICHSSVPSNAAHTRPFRCPYEGHTSCPFTPPSFYPNNLKPNTSLDVSNSTEMPTPNPVVDLTHPTDLLERVLGPKSDSVSAFGHVLQLPTLHPS
jgi:hypothetical protein